MQNILISQAILILVGCAAFSVQGSEQALATAFGGAIAIANGLLLFRRVRRAAASTAYDPRSDVASLYMGAVERFVLTLGAMALGMGWLELSPVPMLVGFGLGYLGYSLSRFMPESPAGTPCGPKSVQSKQQSE